MLAALTDGEDFELLFTVASRDAVPLLDAWKKQFPGLALTCIGKIKAGRGHHHSRQARRATVDGSWLRAFRIAPPRPPRSANNGAAPRESGLVIGLSGDLGAGKTQFVKGLARGLGIATRVHSPTFALVNIYSGGRLTLFHLDLYRLDTPEQITAAGLEDYLEPAGVTVIEWAERWFGEASRGRARSPLRAAGTGKTALVSGRRAGDCAPYLVWVEVEVLSETERRITYEDSGA